MPRPPAGTITGAPPLLDSTASVPSAPPPWPTTLIDTVAMPAAAYTDAWVHGAPYMLSVKPWPKIATGHPPAGLVPAGRNICTTMPLLDCACGCPVSVAVGGKYLPAVW